MSSFLPVTVSTCLCMFILIIILHIYLPRAVCVYDEDESSVAVFEKLTFAACVDSDNQRYG